MLETVEALAGLSRGDFEKGEKRMTDHTANGPAQRHKRGRRWSTAIYFALIF